MFINYKHYNNFTKTLQFLNSWDNIANITKHVMCVKDVSNNKK